MSKNFEVKQNSKFFAFRVIGIAILVYIFIQLGELPRGLSSTHKYTQCHSDQMHFLYHILVSNLSICLKHPTMKNIVQRNQNNQLGREGGGMIPATANIEQRPQVGYWDMPITWLPGKRDFREVMD